MDTNHNGVLDAGPTNSGEEYNTTTRSFTTPPVKSTMAAGLQYVDAIGATPHTGDIMMNGTDLLNVLTAFNAGELVTLMGGPRSVGKAAALDRRSTYSRIPRRASSPF